ncbi:hypothetical protein BDF14DRAFT_1725201 [Spinellus fusiger]|nr:hypothetical protein BDF14DRAFT_1725201 [Spinellus fusiger]
MSHLVVYGGAGALGRSIVSFFKNKGWTVINVDLVENPGADYNTCVNSVHSPQHQANELITDIGAMLKGAKVDAVLSVAGGWADFIATSELMWKQSVMSSIMAAHISSEYLKKGGLLVLSGAAAACQPTPGMIGYGVAKAAVHHLVKDLASSGSGVPEDTKVIGICPKTLDTPMNRKDMPNADFLSWTPTETVARQLYDYAIGNVQCKSGSLIEIATSKGDTQFNEI